MKRIISFIIIAVLLCAALSSCVDYADYPEYENVTYRESGLEFTLRNDMRRGENENYDFYFTNMIGSLMFGASKIDADTLSKVGVTADATASEYVDRVIERNGFDRELIYYSHNEDSGSYSFRYSIGNEGESGLFYYVTVLGKPGNLWFVEMVCDEDDSAIYLDRFDSWRSTLRTYEE